MWSPDPSVIVTAEQRVAEEAAAARKAQFPNLEPDQFWAALRFFGRLDQRDYEGELRAWVAALEPSPSEGVQTQAYIDALMFWSTVSAKIDRAKWFERDHPMIEVARQALGLSTERLDEMWGWGAS